MAAHYRVPFRLRGPWCPLWLNLRAVHTAHISALLSPFIQALAPAQLQGISTYIDVLLRWNQRVNLTAVRDPEQIVTRHFGESLFAARHLLTPADTSTAIDVGSGAGFPGLPLKIYAPALRLTLIESHARKSAFLREVIRALGLVDATVFHGRAQDFPARADLVTLRAVEKFERILPVAARLVSPGGRLALLIGAGQFPRAARLLPALPWSPPIALPQSASRVLVVASAPS
ncbi:MAG TPA: 16S rRNA (guanine(527)-N(7))-methyltransferase RsmG [Terriglobales bacterium]|nr:16S rRNA (guanine(527)-N(7))-methyltransferase RsmG [Terriglobales bacterium]